MYCPLKEIDLNTEVCPVKCIYRRADGSCAHNQLAYDEDLDEEEIAQIKHAPVEEVHRRGVAGKRRIRIALVVDNYLGYANPGSVNEVGKDEHPIFRVFNLPKRKLKTILNKERFEKWRQLSKVDVTFEDVKDLFLTVLRARTR